MSRYTCTCAIFIIGCFVMFLLIELHPGFWLKTLLMIAGVSGAHIIRNTEEP